jgi:hypothetical protein
MHNINPEPPSALAAPRPNLAGTSDWRSRIRRAMLSYAFVTLDDQADPTFNQLLGINDNGVIAGYFGSGMPASTHPNKGYTVDLPYGQGNYVNENFPGSQQTQVTAIDNKGATVGFWADAADDNFGFVDRNGRFTDVVDPHGQDNAGNGMTTEQLLGVNNQKLRWASGRTPTATATASSTTSTRGRSPRSASPGPRC